MLQHFRWNEDRLLDKYMDAKPSVLREAGEPQNIVSPENPGAKPPKKRARLDTPTEAVCDVCCDVVGIDDFFKLRCAHAFCRTVHD